MLLKEACRKLFDLNVFYRSISPPLSGLTGLNIFIFDFYSAEFFYFKVQKSKTELFPPLYYCTS